MSKPNNQPTARDQYVQDISLVLDNDHESYKLIRAEAIRLMAQEEFINSANWLLAKFIENYVENTILKALKQKPSDYTAGVGSLLVAQLCFGWGIDPYYDYASSITATLRESVAI